MDEQQRYTLVVFSDGLLALTQSGDRAFLYNETGGLTALLASLRSSQSGIKEFQATEQLSILKNVVLTQDICDQFRPESRPNFAQMN